MDEELFGGDSPVGGDADKEDAVDEQPTQTQTQVKGFLSDIFGDDDDDDGIKGSGGGGLRDSDDELNDSSDEDVTTKRKSKLGKKKDKGREKESKKKGKEGKKKDKDKGKKRKQSDGPQVTSSGRVSKKPSAPKERDPNAPPREEGDAYDSEEDVVATRDDRQFLADEDDGELAGVVAEYDDDDQNFDDERPRKKAKGGSGGGGFGGSGRTKELDPLSETLKEMKKPKTAEITDTEKGKLSTDLLNKMEEAALKDDRLLEVGKPAVHKLNLLTHVQAMVNVRSLQGTLLDFDILRAFVTWLRPRPDKSLPSITLRTAIYEMLAKLPCQTDHLKRVDSKTKMTIGMIVVMLLKSKLETDENKRRLKGLVERWARPIYGKQTDARSSNYEDNAEIRAVSMANSRLTADDSSGAVGDLFDSGDKRVDPHKRVRTPFSNGFLYTVKPDVPLVEKLDPSGALGASRQALIKRMKDTKAVAYGKKLNPRAMDMAMSGRNKS